MTHIKLVALFTLLCCNSLIAEEARRPRAREAGVVVGILPVGAQNAITDVAGVMVGHKTIIQGENVRTGITVILPHKGNLFREKVPGAVFVGNAFGKLIGSTQVNELGEIETPIVLTSTLAVPRVADGVIDYMLALPGNEDVQSVNPLVGETNDGWLNDIRERHITSADVAEAIRVAKGVQLMKAPWVLVLAPWRSDSRAGSEHPREHFLSILAATLSAYSCKRTSAVC
jgi:D-aminopeptidase